MQDQLMIMLFLMYLLTIIQHFIAIRLPNGKHIQDWMQTQINRLKQLRTLMI